MRGRWLILYFLLILFSLIGCSKREENLKQDSESASVELTLPQIPQIPEVSETPEITEIPEVEVPQIPELPPPYKPTNKDIQIALKNAGFYNGDIDSKIGPKTRKAILEFQAKNNLAVDGKVGPKTWSVLKEYLY